MENDVTPREKIKYKALKLLPYIFVGIAEIGLALFILSPLFLYGARYGIQIQSWWPLLIPGCIMIAAIVLTALAALNIRHRTCIAVAVICVAVAVMFYLLIAAIGNFIAASQFYETYLDYLESGNSSADDWLLTSRQYSLQGSFTMVFIVTLIPLCVYLPVRIFKSKNSNE